MALNLRKIAAQVIDAVTDGQSLANCLDAACSQIPEARDRALVHAIVYGVCRFYFRLDVCLSYLLKSPMRAKDSDVHAVLLVGLYQLFYMRVPNHAAVSETVGALASKKQWARNLVNAVLRECLREQENLIKKLDGDREALYAHPDWLIDEIQSAYPNEAELIFAANNIEPPFSLRINLPQQTRTAWMTESSLPAAVIDFTDSGVILESPCEVTELPGFKEGKVSVQDGAPQLAPLLLGLAKGQRVLDACAAPGGKLMHLCEAEPHLAEVIAIEVDANRAILITENRARLKCNTSIKVITADATDVAAWWDGELFDRILLDAPCSATGVIRRHPDIKLLRQASDISTLATLQLQLLKNLWPLLKPSGVLLYATCSILPAENQFVVAAFIKDEPTAVAEVIDAAWGIPVAIGRQILPGMHQMDGFYYAKLRKKSHPGN